MMRYGRATLRICEKGHRYYKSSDCPTCPVCEKERKPESGFLARLNAPARRAFEKEGITDIKTLSEYTESEILSLHGIGPSSIPVLNKILSEADRKFKT